MKDLNTYIKESTTEYSDIEKKSVNEIGKRYKTAYNSISNELDTKKFSGSSVNILFVDNNTVDVNETLHSFYKKSHDIVYPYNLHPDYKSMLVTANKDNNNQFSFDVPFGFIVSVGNGKEITLVFNYHYSDNEDLMNNKGDLKNVSILLFKIGDSLSDKKQTKFDFVPKNDKQAKNIELATDYLIQMFKINKNDEIIEKFNKCLSTFVSNL